MLCVAQLQAQAQTGLTHFQGLQQLLAGNQPLGRLLGFVVAFVAGVANQLTCQQTTDSSETVKHDIARDDGFLFLSDEGFEFLTTVLELKSYEIPFTEPIELSPQTIVFLERYIDCPYFLTAESITVFSERKSFELYMFSDDIRKFGLIKAMNERQKSLDQENNG